MKHARKKPGPLSRDEQSLLLYAESCAVDCSGKMAGVRINGEDIEILRCWNESGFVRFGRIPMREIISAGRAANTHWCVLSDAAWKAAAKLRRERAERNPCLYAHDAILPPQAEVG